MNLESIKRINRFNLLISLIDRKRNLKDLMIDELELLGFSRENIDTYIMEYFINLLDKPCNKVDKLEFLIKLLQDILNEKKVMVIEEGEPK